MDDVTKVGPVVGVGSDAIADRAAEALHDYEIGLAEAQRGRNHAIAAIIKYGLALTERRAVHRSNIAFNAWIRANGLDQVKPFEDRQERAAAMQMAKLVFDGTVRVWNRLRRLPVFAPSRHDAVVKAPSNLAASTGGLPTLPRSPSAPS